MSFFSSAKVYQKIILTSCVNDIDIYLRDVLINWKCRINFAGPCVNSANYVPHAYRWIVDETFQEFNCPLRIVPSTTQNVNCKKHMHKNVKS